MVCAGVGLGLALGRRGTDTASLSAVGAAGAAGALRTLPTKSVSRDICIGTTGVCGGEGAERTEGGGVQDLTSPSDVGPEPLRTEPRRSANFAVAFTSSSSTVVLLLSDDSFVPSTGLWMTVV